MYVNSTSSVAVHISRRSTRAVSLPVGNARITYTITTSDTQPDTRPTL